MRRHTSRHDYRAAAALTVLPMLLGALCACGGAHHTSAVPAKPVASVPNTTAAPAELRWDTYHGVRVPRSPIDGPADTATDIATGYRDTPQGAVLAAINGEAYLALAGDDEWGQAVAVLTAPGPGRADFTAQRAPLSVTGTVPANLAPHFPAFKITSYRAANPGTAAVRVVEQVGTGPLFSYPVALQWLAGDWRIVLPTSGEHIDVTELTSLTGYTRLQGAS